MPTSFRARPAGSAPMKKQMPHSGNPTGPNSRPFMRSDATMGGKTPNMSPRAGVSSFVAPPPQGRIMGDGGRAPRMMANGGKAGKRMLPQFMADGGMDAPDDLGGAPDQMPPDTGAQPDAGMPPVIRPEAVAYHDGHQACENCTYNSGGHCQVLQMQIDPTGACNAWEAGSGAGEPDQDDMIGKGDEGNPMGTSAAS